MNPYYEDDLVALYQGDCLEVAQWLDADVLVTDPPYGIGFRSSRAGALRGVGIANDGDTAARDAVLGMWNGPALVFGSWRMPKPPGTHTVLTWDKGPGVGMGDLSVPWKPNAEEIYVIGKGFVGPRTTSVLTGHHVVTHATKGRVHPSMKPVSLMELLIAKSPGVIADPFAGSGSTLVAAKMLGRRAVGVELDERYCEIAAKRLTQDTLFGEVSA